MHALERLSWLLSTAFCGPPILIDREVRIKLCMQGDACSRIHPCCSLDVKACCATGAKLCRSLARHAAYQLISRLTVDVQNVSAAFNLDAPIASLAPAADFVPSGVWHPRAAGSGAGTSGSAAAMPEPTAGSTTASRAVRFQPDEPLGSCARVSLRSLTVNSATPQGYGVLATMCQLSGVDLAVDRPHAAGAAGEHCACMRLTWESAVAKDHMACTMATTSPCNYQSERCFPTHAGERLHMVRRWSARAAVDWRIASRMLDMHKRVGETPVLQASGNVYPVFVQSTSIIILHVCQRIGEHAGSCL